MTSGFVGPSIALIQDTILSTILDKIAPPITIFGYATIAFLSLAERRPRGILKGINPLTN